MHKFESLFRFFASTYEGIQLKPVLDDLFDRAGRLSFPAAVSVLVQKARVLKDQGQLPHRYDSAFAGLSIHPKAHIALVYHRYFRLSKKVIAALLSSPLEDISAWIKEGRRAYAGGGDALLFQPFERGLQALFPEAQESLFVSFEYFRGRRRNAKIRIAIWIAISVVFVLASIYFALFATGHFGYGR